MRFGSLVAALAVAGSMAGPAAGSSTSIGVFFDADATDCDQTTQPLTPFSVYVVATLGADAAANGITGAGLRVEGLADIVLSVTPNPAASVAIGDPTGVAAFATRSVSWSRVKSMFKG